MARLREEPVTAVPDLAAWLREAITERLELAQKATPGPWRWGDWSATFGTPEMERNALEHSPGHGPFPNPERRDIEAIGVLRLQDSLECDDRPEREASALFIAANDPLETIARCEAELAILGEHKPVDVPGMAWRGCATCKDSVTRWPKTFPCRTVRLLGSGYRHRDGYREDLWKP